MGPLRNKDNSGFDKLYFDKFIDFGDMVFFCICCMGFLDFWVGIWDVGHALFLCRYYYIYYYHLFLLLLNYYQCYDDQYNNACEATATNHKNNLQPSAKENQINQIKTNSEKRSNKSNLSKK